MAPDRSDGADPADRSARAVRRVVALVFLAGVVGVVAVFAFGRGRSAPVDLPGLMSWVLVGGVFVLAVAAEFVRVPIPRRSGNTEELAFVEVAIVVAALVLPPFPAVLVLVSALVVASFGLRRAPVKLFFNVGGYAAGASLLLLIYLALGASAPPFGLQSVVALLVGTAAFAVVNGVTLAELFHALEGIRRTELYREGWALSATMAVGGVAVGATAVALGVYTPVLVAFALFPALALWLVYRLTADRERDKERTDQLLEFGLALAAPVDHAREEWLPTAVECVRRVAGADRAELVLPPAPVPVPGDSSAAALPAGWEGAHVVPVDLGGGATGALLLAGSAHGLRSDDAALVAALATAISSALRADVAHRALVEETETLRAVIRYSGDGIAVVDPDDRVRVWSPALAHMTGVDVTGLPRDALPEQAAAIVDPATTDGAAHPVSITMPSGDTRDLTVFVARDTGEGAASLGIFTVHDDTARRRADRLKSDFVATISHELRTPITPIQGYAQLLARRGDRMDPERRRQALELIAERADHLSRLVDDLLLASQVSGTTRLTIEEGDVDLRDVVRSTVESFPRLGDRVELTVPSTAVMAHCDAHRVGQCLANLLSNAEKYTPMETVVEVSLTGPGEGGRYAVLTVRDHGQGIPYDEQERVFERFYRMEDPWTMRTGGSGLGLHIASELAHAMGGSLTLVSEPGDGCTFALALPVAGSGKQAHGLVTSTRRVPREGLAAPERRTTEESA